MHITTKDRAHMRAWLHHHGVHHTPPGLVTALITLFRRMEETYEPRNHHQATTQNGQ